ncbi:MAG: transporter ATPase [Sphingobacteriaceae bacterium]|jgi:hypothetical protein|nr:transporter ATPase [Sphingobacteriaceae bacterium]
MEMSESSRVWVYQSNRALTAAESQQIQDTLNQFTSQWLAHGHQLAARGEVRYNRFLILMVDERQAGATGCSIDKSVGLMKQIESQFNINLFDRFNIAWRDGEQISSCGRQEFESLIASGRVDENTIVFNNLVQTVAELNSKWEVTFKESWHQQVFGSLVNS